MKFGHHNFSNSSFQSRMPKNDSVPQYVSKQPEPGYGCVLPCFAPKMEGFTKDSTTP
jgi:hypothetical protein